MGHASYGNNSQQDQQPAERHEPKTAERRPEKGKDRPGLDLGDAKDKTDRPDADLPAAGPHGKPDLTTEKATPGAGALPDAGDQDATDSTTG